MKFLLLAHDEPNISLLRQGVGFLLLGVPLENKKACGVSIEEVLIREQTGDTRQWFQTLSVKFEKSLEREELTVLVSGVRPYCLNPLIDSGWESILAMLILAFPEARWLFGTIQGYAVANPEEVNALDAFRSSHGIENLFKASPNPLFDPQGLRDWVRGVAASGEHSITDVNYLSRREQFAISLDDEIAYSSLHAYTAYRFGYRAADINSSSLAKRILGKDSPATQLKLAFEDIYVNFADGPRGMSWLIKRSTEWLLLDQAEHRIFVSSGLRLSGDNEKWQSNKEYLANRKAAGQRIKTLDKPHAGIFRIWEGSGLMRKLHWIDSATGKTRRGVAKGFIWPPPKDSFTENEHGHSSPGVMLIIAENLIERAEKLLPQVRSVPDAVHGAVLANDALEILGGRTPTVAVEALRLKHQFEVLAECQFSGVEHHIHLKERMDEIRRDVRAISVWFGRKQQRTAVLNAEMKILLDIIHVLQKYTQFDEEQVVMNRIRYLHNSLWMRGQPHEVIPWRYLFWLPLRYTEFLLASFLRFFVSILLWIAGLTFLFWIFRDFGVNSPHDAGWNSFSDAFSSFTGRGKLPTYGIILPMLTVFAEISGLAHLGVFISHLYALVKRK